MRRNNDEFALIWADMIRGLSVLCVMVHHWFLFLPGRSGYAFLSQSVDFVQTVGGTFVHLFFFLSGYGLAASYFNSNDFSWHSWSARRIRKIIVPYWIFITATFLLVNSAHWVSAQQFGSHYSFLSLFCYATFTRNFYPPCWDFNPTFWFMPVIFGLYLLFPILLWLLKKCGVRTFILVSVLITYGSILLFLLFGYEIVHNTALPFFFISPFAIGMALALTLKRQVHFLAKLSSPYALLLGVGFYFSSWLLIHAWDQGSTFNDTLTTAGLIFMCIPACKFVFHVFPGRFTDILTFCSKHSYLMYLLHGALILYVIKPVLQSAFPDGPDLLVLTGLAGFYVVAVTFLAAALYRPVKALSGLVFGEYWGSAVVVNSVKP
jgi:peptidoglycan/LPS O-acetylase OafA/YrhL